MSSPRQILERILSARGLSSADYENWLQPDYEKSLHDWRKLPDISAAVKRLVKARNKQEPVVVYGDYDIDGICGSTLLHEALSAMGFEATVFIPDRFEHGYGLNTEALTKLSKAGTKLVISVDCGTTAVEQVRGAKAMGLDIIVTDHHEPPDELPPAVAVINPKRSDSRYPFKELAGTGVAFKLVQALQENLPGMAKGQEKWLLDLVAFATVCDVVPLVDENRALVHFGLKVWPKTRRAGLKALSQVAQRNLDDISSYDLGFIYGPRLNAAGRLETAKTALELLQSKSQSKAMPLAIKLDDTNTLRREIQAAIEQEVIGRIDETSPVIVEAGQNWSHGVVGIVASRVMEKFRRPVFLAQILPDGTAKGSARSFGDFNIAEALNSVRNLLISGGGHAAAGGFSLPAEDVDKFRRGLLDYYASLKLPDQKAYFSLKPDVTLRNLTGVGLELAGLIKQMEPFGMGNPEPLLKFSQLQAVSSRRMGSDGQHLKLVLSDGNKQIEAVHFNAESVPATPSKLEVMGNLRVNRFNGRSSPQLILKSWQV